MSLLGLLGLVSLLSLSPREVLTPLALLYSSPRVFVLLFLLALSIHTYCFFASWPLPLIVFYCFGLK